MKSVKKSKEASYGNGAIMISYIRCLNRFCFDHGSARNQSANVAQFNCSHAWARRGRQ